MEAAAVRMRLTWVAVAFASALTFPLIKIGADARWLAAMGQEIVRTGSIPHQIPYAAAPSSHWSDVPVLAELVFHWLEALLGDHGLVFAQAGAVLAALLLLALDMRAAGIADGARGLVLVAVTIAAAPAFVVARSQLFSLALFPLLAFLLRSEDRSPTWRIWLIVPLLAIWSNLHGGVLVGLAVACAYLVLRRLRHDKWRALAVLAGSVGAIFATPALLRSGTYYVHVLHGEAAKTGDGMWGPLSVHSVFDVVFVVVAVPLAILAVRARPARWELVCLAALAGSAVAASRNAVWFALLVAAPAATKLGKTRLARIAPRPHVAAACYCGPLVLAVGGFAAPARGTGATALLLRKAVAIADGKPILADDFDAEQLALRRHRVWIANPLDAFGAREQRAYLAWLHGDPAGDRLRDRVGRTVLVVHDTAPDKRLRADPKYRLVARDRVAVLYVQRPDG